MARKSKKGSAVIERELFSKIQQKAYEFYEKRGYSHGSDQADWIEAEGQIKRDLGIKK